MELEEFGIIILENPEEILKYLQLGTTIPIWPEFHKFILNDFKQFNVKSILMTKFGNICGHMLIFDYSTDILFFGYFRVLNDDSICIMYLLNELIAYAKHQNYKKIRGPINLPTIIFGWGFMEDGSQNSLFLGKPVNNPIYQNLFINNGFSITNKELTWEGEIPSIDQRYINKYNTNDYDIYNPTNRKELFELKHSIIDLSSKNLPKESILTPNIQKLIDNYISFALNYGSLFMFVLVKYKKFGNLVAFTLCLANPFRVDKNGNFISICPFIVVVDKAHRKQGIGFLMAKFLYDSARKNNFKLTSSPIESRNSLMIQLVKNILKFEKTRTHIILEKNIFEI